MRGTLAERFWAKVKKSDGCWEWTASCHHQWGYGHFKVAGRVESAHRVSWELHHGPIPDGLGVLHRCDNPPCVRPDHLFLGTDGDNARDMAAKGRNAKTNLLKTHCPRGHEYTPDNTRIYRSRKGWTMRFCCACRRDRDNASYPKNRRERIARAVASAKARRKRDPEAFKKRQREYMRASRARKRESLNHSPPPAP